ncbi:type II toxin-antitoxin system death-on-curing family toxin [bacterium]|nr:type II toxin-antitoxin system death-on-curing family toxin [bacterium]
MKYLHYKQILFIYKRVIEASGGSPGIRDEGLLHSALARPKMTFERVSLYPTLFDKVAALGHSLIRNHPFVDGNKRLAFEAMDITLRLNGYQLTASEDEKFTFVIEVARGNLDEKDMAHWLKENTRPIDI